MAVELADAKGSLNVTADELGITPQILTRWRRERVASQNTGVGSRAQVSQEQQEILRLKKELKQAELDRIAEATRYFKKGGRHLLQERRKIFGFIKEDCKPILGHDSQKLFWCRCRRNNP